jgi:hypothetical protein
MQRLSLDAALCFLQALGSVSEKEIRKMSTFSATNLTDVKRVCESAARALSEWPNGFYEVLSRAMAFRSPTTPRLSFSQAFGTFYQYYLKVHFRKEFQFLQNAFASFAALQWQGVIRGQHRAVGTETKRTAQFLPAAQASKAAGISVARITTLVRQAVIKGVFIQTPKGRCRKECWIDRHRLAEWVTMRDGDLECYLLEPRARKLLGLSHTTFRYLINAAIVSSVTGFDRGFPRGTYIPSEEITNILGAFDESLRTSKLLASPQTVMLRDAVRIYLGREGLAEVIGAVINGRLFPVERRVFIPGLLGYFFCLDDLNAFRFRARAAVNPPNGFMTYKQAAARLSANVEIVRNLVASRLLKTSRERFRGSKLVRETDVNAFASKYVSVSFVAAELKTSSKSLVRSLHNSGVMVLDVTLQGKGKKLFVRRSDIGNAEQNTAILNRP